MHDLHKFQRDILRRLAIGGEASGLELKADLEDDGYNHINHGRLYPNLDELVDMGLVAKHQVDGRTNAYKLTRRGASEVRDHAREWSAAFDALATTGPGPDDRVSRVVQEADE